MKACKVTTDGKNYSIKPTGRKLTRYDEFTGEPYEIDETKLVEDQDGMFVIEERTYGPAMPITTKRKKK